MQFLDVIDLITGAEATSRSRQGRGWWTGDEAEFNFGIVNLSGAVNRHTQNSATGLSKPASDRSSGWNV